MMQSIAERLNKAKAVALICHISPDGDTLGSATALRMALERMGKRCDIYCDGVIPANLVTLLPGVDEVRKPDGEVYDTAVAIDVSDEARMGEALGIFQRAEYRLNIDHHQSNTLFGQVNLIRSCGATGMIIRELLEELGTLPDRDMATALYIAISTDTGGLCYSNTTPDTFRAVAALAEQGIEIASINDTLYKRRSLTQTRTLAKGLERLQVAGRVAYICLTHAELTALGAAEGDTDGLVNYAREIEGIEIAFLAKEKEEGRIKVSLRANGEADVASVAAVFGGGGHRQAAGCTIEASMDEAVRLLLQAIGEG